MIMFWWLSLFVAVNSQNESKKRQPLIIVLLWDVRRWVATLLFLQKYCHHHDDEKHSKTIKESNRSERRWSLWFWRKFFQNEMNHTQRTGWWEESRKKTIRGRRGTSLMIHASSSQPNILSCFFDETYQTSHGKKERRRRQQQAKQ